MKILTFSSLYPNAAQPYHGVFVENRLRHLVADGRVSARVVAPVPWFPTGARAFGRYADFAAVPREEDRHGLRVLHPRYPVIPAIGMSIAPLLMYVFVRRSLQRMLDDGDDFDLIDAHYFYPDGVAAAMLGRHFAKPVVITARGTDINLIPRYALPRRMILWAARRASGLIAVCQALKDALVDLGTEERRVRVLRNGVNLELFKPADRDAARRRFKLDGPTLVSVGHLIPRKAFDLVIEALPALPGTRLLIAGDGPEDAALRSLAARLGVNDRVRFLGRVPHEDLAGLYTAADVLVLASSREGWANVLLEAMACGTPVVASSVWGTPEVVATPDAGRLMKRRTPDALAAAVTELLGNPPDRAATRAYAEGFSWDATTAGQVALFEEILSHTPDSSRS